ncbi:divalent-cation tolerance protein CutA, partial [Candidatus Saccharibacteria bacterium]|nr:divalent-cation tolerance protein CutA [Candidatus Saccharibacteria bacterium]
MKLITLFLTCANEREAQKIANDLINKKLAACVRLSDVNSTYSWKGEIENSGEVLMMIESTEDKFDEVETIIRQLHSYE